MPFSRPCAIVDLETTGGHLARDRITEIGIILIDGERVERFESLVNPGQPIPSFIQNMTGISDAMVAGAPAFGELAQTIRQQLAGRLLIAHNVRFDYGVLKNEFKRAGLRLQNETLCTVKLSRKLYPEHYKHNLDAVMARHGIVLPERHRALADAEAVYRFLLAAGSALGQDVLASAAEALLAQSAPPAGMDVETFDALPDVPGVFCIHDRQGLPLYVGHDSNLRRGVLAHFTPGHGKALQLAGDAGRIEWTETLGEFGSALLNIVLLKTLRPRLNPKGRMASEVCSLRLQSDEEGMLRPQIVSGADLQGEGSTRHYGLFRTPRDAKKALKELAESQGLCQWVLGVERVTSRKGQPCDGRGKGGCQGACIGREPASAHNARLLKALERLAGRDWPYPGAVAVVERDEVSGMVREHHFDRWCYLGSRDGGSDAPLSGPVLMDPDVVKLLTGYFRKPTTDTSIRLSENS
ncbi:exonuclease domain-containing protein [Paludibacterium purpuratum]|uniref:DNA-directed DNA polymerase n=1 Tax=Paludibacterium purpuratum TaxID=1144873 RepID=A0A4R7BCI5_9NEIS|nr:exonuclease domain-containing protein [Paludibacterium purpuratum]TDR82661.1 DNA polymerase-3 subunit epsilon [Paludibacterium purpuratum]